MTQPRSTFLSLGLIALASASSCVEEDTSGEPLPPIPEADYPVCVGEGREGFTGPCCTNVRCSAADDLGLCPTAQEYYDSLFLGSGGCGCGIPQGPFSSEGTTYVQEDAPCCYVISTMSCLGRPLVVDGELHTATSQPRGDWT